MESDVLLQMTDVCKSFPGVKALYHVSLTVRRGTVHALMGENGAGKSTLMKCLFGIYFKDEGTTLLEGREVNFKSSKDALENGVAMVHQELNQALKRSVMDNLWLGRYPTTGGFIVNEHTMLQETKRVFEELEIDVDPHQIMSTLPVSKRQMVEIAKAVSYNAKIIVFDEPTSSLTEEEVEHLFRIINMLRDKGCGIIYISHRLDEVFACCDSYTVLCDGKYINSGSVAEIDNGKLVKMIIGRELANVYPPVNEELGETILEVKNLTAPKAFRDVNLYVREGEVIGLAGLLGAGKTELVQAIFGDHKVVSGEILVKGKPVHTKKPYQAIRLGMGLVPDERRTLGLNMKFDIKDNTTLPSMKLFRKLGIFQNHEGEARAAYDINEKMNLNYYSLWQNVKKLSGGNQQKIVIAKWMLRDTEIFLLDEPTRGIDIGAKFEIYNLIHELTKQKKAVILVSPEMEELIGLCNRIYIMYEGAVMDEVEGERKTQEVIINSLLGVNTE